MIPPSKSMQHGIMVILVASISIFVPAFAEVGPQPPKPDRLWVGLVAQSPIKDIAEYEHRWCLYVPSDLEGTNPPDIKLEFRRAADQARVATINYTPFHGHDKVMQFWTSDQQPDKELMAALDKLGDGDYVAAYVTEHGRISNVAPFRVDSTVNATSLQAVELINVEPPPYYDLPLLGIRINGAPDVDFQGLTYGAFSQSNIILDGKRRSLTCSVGGGIVSYWTPGTRWVELRDLSGFFDPIIKPGVSHEIALVIPSFTTNPIVLSLLRPLGDAWDKTVYPTHASPANVPVKEHAK